MKRIQTAAAAAALFAASMPAGALAAAPAMGCYARVYDAAHLAAHPKQTVSSLAVALKPLTGQGAYVVTASAVFRIRGKSGRQYVGGDCSRNGDVVRCYMDDDAGEFDAVRTAAGVKVTVTASLRLAGAGQASDESEGPYVDPANPEDRVFLLSPAAAAACR
jgi:hypothetical protein